MTENKQVRDYWVDGHFIAARSEAEARNEVKRLYDHDAETVRLWNEHDNEGQ